MRLKEKGVFDAKETTKEPADEANDDETLVSIEHTEFPSKECSYSISPGAAEKLGGTRRQEVAQVQSEAEGKGSRQTREKKEEKRERVQR